MNWRAVALLFAALAAAVTLAAWRWLSPAPPPAHRIFINGQILSMDAQNTVHEALSVRGEQIEELGTNDEIMAGRSDGTVVTDLAGRRGGKIT